MKKVLLILLVLVVLVVLGIAGVVVYGVSQIDAIFKRAIEDGGAYATGVETTVDTVDVGLTTGTFDMGGLSIANPDGYTSPHFLSLGEGALGVKLQTASTQHINLPEFRLSHIDVNLDKSAGEANYQVILNNLKRFESGDKGSKPESESTGPKVSIDVLKIEDVNVHLVGFPGVSQVAGDVSVNVPLVELRDVGSGDGMTFGEITNLVIKTVLSAAVEAGGGIIPQDILNNLSSQLAQLDSLSAMGVDVVGELGDRIENMGGQVLEDAQQQVDDAVKNVQDQAGQAVDDAAEQVKKGLGGILGGDDEDDGGP